MHSVEQRIASLAVHRHSLVTYGGMIEAGITRREIERRQECGLIVPRFRGVFAMAGAEPTYEERVLAACLATGGVASHRCAARLFGLRGFGREERVEISVPSRRATKLDGVVAHTSNLLELKEDPDGLADRLWRCCTSIKAAA